LILESNLRTKSGDRRFRVSNNACHSESPQSGGEEPAFPHPHPRRCNSDKTMGGTASTVGQIRGQRELSQLILNARMRSVPSVTAFDSERRRRFDTAKQPAKQVW
jgi:hypothetical protein